MHEIRGPMSESEFSLTAKTDRYLTSYFVQKYRIGSQAFLLKLQSRPIEFPLLI